MALSTQQINDLINTTLKNLPNDVFEVMWDSQQYELCRIYNEQSRRISGGTSIQRNVLLDQNGRARYRQLYDTDDPTVDQGQVTIDVPWTQLSVDYSWDKVELITNRPSGAGFIDLIKSRRTERMWDLAELIESRGWVTPTSATDKLHPYGIPYYLNFLNNGSNTGGFHGQTIRYQNGTTGTTCAGIDAAVESKWRNYADVYTQVDNGLLKKLRSAFRLTHFKPAAFVPKPGNDARGTGVKCYTDNDTITSLEELMDLRDDNNAPDDLAGKVVPGLGGSVYFNRTEFCYIPQLEGYSVIDGGSNSFQPAPIFCVDWSKLQPVVREGYWMEESEPMTDRRQHTVHTVFLDGSHNNLCTNRRTAGFVLHKTIPAA